MIPPRFARMKRHNTFAPPSARRKALSDDEVGKRTVRRADFSQPLRTELISDAPAALRAESLGRARGRDSLEARSRLSGSGAHRRDCLCQESKLGGGLGFGGEPGAGFGFVAEGFYFADVLD